VWVNDVVIWFNRVGKPNTVLLKEKYNPLRNVVSFLRAWQSVFICYMSMCICSYNCHFSYRGMSAGLLAYIDHCVPEPHNSKRIYLARKYECITQIHNMDKHTAISVPDVI